MKIKIDQLAIAAIIGIHPWEREIRQTLLIDIEFAIPEPTHDQIDATVNYSDVQSFVREQIQTGEFRLIEFAAKATAQAVAAKFKLNDVQIRVTKPAASSSARSVSADYHLQPETST
jgi:dihydroneopterin aldolase